MTDERLAHVEGVAGLVVRWAEALGVPDNERHRWLRAVWLHDAMRDAPAKELKQWAPSAEGPMNLRHGPAAAARAKAQTAAYVEDVVSGADGQLVEEVLRRDPPPDVELVDRCEVVHACSLRRPAQLLQAARDRVEQAAMGVVTRD